MKIELALFGILLCASVILGQTAHEGGCLTTNAQVCGVCVRVRVEEEGSYLRLRCVDCGSLKPEGSITIASTATYRDLSKLCVAAGNPILKAKIAVQAESWSSVLWP